MARILVIEDDKNIRLTVDDVLSGAGHRVTAAASAADGWERFSTTHFDLALLDIRLPDGSGGDLLKKIRSADSNVPVILMTAFPDASAAVAAMKAGAFDYLIKPFDLDDLLMTVSKALEVTGLKHMVASQRRVAGAAVTENIGESAEIGQVRDMISRVATASNTTVLILGETGVGKELVANGIHAQSSRAGKPVIRLNCSAIPETLLEAELFGVERGAFTDARESREGLLQMADGGTLYLDEIGDLPLSLQPKLLRVIEDKTYRRLGGRREFVADVRILASTNRDLAANVAAGRFREDLYFRLKVMVIHVPPLRNRGNDVLLLARHFLARFGNELGRKNLCLSAEAEERLLRYHWPGNVRELRNVIERACILAPADIIMPALLVLEPLPAHPAGNGHGTLADAEKRHILTALNQCDGNKSRAAELLGISRSTLKEKLKEYGAETHP